MFNFLKKIFGTGSSQGPDGFSFLQRVTSRNIERGTDSLIKAYNSSPWLRAAASKVAYSVATVQWQVFAMKPNGSKKFKQCRKAQIGGTYESRAAIRKQLRNNGELVEIEEHPLLDLLNGGNPLMHGLNNNKMNQVYIDLVGQSFLIKERGPLDVPIALWVTSPLWVTEFPTTGKPFFKINVNGVVQDFPAEDVICFTDPDPFCPYERGSGVGRSLGDELDVDDFASSFIKDFFLNGARPDLIVSADGIKPSDTRRLERKWNHDLRGMGNHHRAQFLNKKLEIQIIGQDLKALNVTDLRKFERDLITQVWGLPPEILGIIENSNRATSVMAEKIMAKWVVVPRLELQRATYQQSLVNDFDDRIILDYVSPVPEDKEHKLEVMKNAPYAFNVDEHREAAGESPKEDGSGSIHFVPTNLVPVEDISNVDLDKFNQGGITKNQKQVSEAQIEQLVGAVEARTLHNAVKSEITSMVSEFGENIREGFFDSPTVSEFINTESLSHISSTVNNTTKNSLRKTLQESLQAGESIVTLTARISDVFDEAVGRRARTIARTESVRISNFGSVEGMKQAGFKGKSWLSSRDGAVRNSHAGMDGQKVAVGGHFRSPVTGASGPFPGSLGLAEEDVNCRCTVLPEAQLKDMSEMAKDTFWKDFEAQRRPFERSYMRSLRKGFKAQRSVVLEKLNEIIRR